MQQEGGGCRNQYELKRLLQELFVHCLSIVFSLFRFASELQMHFLDTSDFAFLLLCCRNLFSAQFFYSCCDTQELWFHTLQRTDTKQQRNNIITLFGKRGVFISAEPPLAADTLYLREIGILITHLLVCLTNTPKYPSIFLLKIMCHVESIIT